MLAFRKFGFLLAVAIALFTGLAKASMADDLVAALAGNDEQARALARQRLPREGIDVVPKLLPLLGQENAAVREAAYQVLADMANEASAPGRSADRAAMTAQLMTLVQPDQPLPIKVQGLRLLTIAVPPDGDVSPLAALLDDRDVREKARESLEEIATAPSKTTIRDHLAKADPDFACALLNSLGRLHDRDGIETIAAMTRNGNPKVRAAAARALAWTGDPAHLKSVQSVIAAADPETRSDANDALLRLLASMSRQASHQHAALLAYRDLLPTSQGPVNDAALAGLGRLGDASSVPAILAAIRDAEAPTLLVGMNALGAIPGSDATHTLVEAYPNLPPPAQQAMIRILGERRDPLVLPILEKASHSDRADLRTLALEEMGESGLPQALKLLAAEAKQGDDAHRAKVQEIINRHITKQAAERRDRIAAQGHGPEFLALLGIIGRWWVVGPFDLGEKNEGWQTAYLGEPNVSVVARYMAGKTRRQWKLVESHDSQGKIDLRATVADRDNCIGYAYTEIELDQPADGALLLGVDDSEKIWVNGVKVHELFTARGLVIDQDRVPVHLKAGKNTILLKLYQNTLGWEFCARLVTSDGRPIPFTQKQE